MESLELYEKSSPYKIRATTESLLQLNCDLGSKLKEWVEKIVVGTAKLVDLWCAAIYEPPSTSLN